MKGYGWKWIYARFSIQFGWGSFDDQCVHTLNLFKTRQQIITNNQTAQLTVCYAEAMRIRSRCQEKRRIDKGLKAPNRFDSLFSVVLFVFEYVKWWITRQLQRDLREMINDEMWCSMSNCIQSARCKWVSSWEKWMDDSLVKESILIAASTCFDTNLGTESRVRRVDFWRILWVAQLKCAYTECCYGIGFWHSFHFTPAGRHFYTWCQFICLSPRNADDFYGRAFEIHIHAKRKQFE